MWFQPLTLLCSLTPLLLALATPSDPKAPAETEPRYETTTTIDAVVIVTEIK